MVGLKTIPAESRALVESALAALNATPVADRLQAAWIFGSHASGSARADSDLDLAVLAEPPLAAAEIAAVSASISEAICTRVDLVDLREASTLLRVEATQHGIRITAGDPASADRFVAESLADHLSFAANRRMLTKALLERLHV